jgi:hypothetical protein
MLVEKTAFDFYIFQRMRFCFVCKAIDCVGCRAKFLQGKPAITKDFFLIN